FTLASTPSSSLSFFSTRFAHEAQVIPPIFSSTPVRLTSVLGLSVVIIVAFRMLVVVLPVPGLHVLADGAAGWAGGEHQRRGVDPPIDLENPVEQVPA